MSSAFKLEECNGTDFHLIDDFDASYVTDLSSMQDDEDRPQEDIY